MKTKRYFLLGIIMLLVILPLVSAAPRPTQIVDNGCEIEVQKFATIAEGQDFKFHVHVINTTSLPDPGIMTNDSTDCLLHMYNETNHIVETWMGFDGNLMEWDYLVLGENFTIGQTVPFYVQCNSTDAICGDSDSFLVSYDGREVTNGQSILYVGFLLVMCLLFISGFVGIGLLPQKDTQDEEGKILSISYLKYFRNTLWLFEWVLLMGITYIASNLAFVYLGEQLFAGVLFAISMMMLAGLPIIVIVWLAWIFRTILHDIVQNRLLKRGIFPQGDI